MSTTTRRPRMGSSSPTAIILTVVSVVLVVAGAIFICIYCRRLKRRRAASSAAAAWEPSLALPQQQQQPGQSRLKSLWILVRRHIRWGTRGHAASSRRSSRPMSAHGTEVMSRSQSYATSIIKDQTVVILSDHPDASWQSSQYRPQQQRPIMAERQHTALPISLDLQIHEAYTIDSHFEAQYHDIQAPTATEDSMNGANGRAHTTFDPISHPTSFPQRPPLAAKHSMGGSTLSIPRMVFGGSLSPSRLHDYRHNNDDSQHPVHRFNESGVTLRPVALQRTASDTPSLACSVPRTVTPMDEPEEEESMNPARTISRGDTVTYR